MIHYALGCQLHKVFQNGHSSLKGSWGNYCFYNIVGPLVRKIIYTYTLVIFKTVYLAFHHYMIAQGF